MSTETTDEEQNGTDLVTLSRLSSADSVHKVRSLLPCQQQYTDTVLGLSSSVPLPEAEGSPVWSRNSALTNDLRRTCGTSMSPSPGWVAAGESASQQAAPLASIQESNHIADSPSPSSSKTSAANSSGHTSYSSSRSDINNNPRPGARVRLEDLFDPVEAGVDSHFCSGYVNPVAVFNDLDNTTDKVDTVNAKKSDSQSLIPCEVSSWKRAGLPGRTYQSPSATSFNTVSSEGPICRICHEGDQAGQSLISPCRCTGTLKYLHAKCLEQWLQTKNKDTCELCNFEFHTRRRTRPLVEWLRHPTNPRDRRNLGVDVICGAILSPLVMVSAWLCLNGSRHYMRHEDRSLEGMGLILLAAVLLAIFMTWSLLTGRYHYMVWREWSKHNQLVTVLPTAKTPSERSHSDHILQEVIDSNGFIGFVRIPRT